MPETSHDIDHELALLTSANAARRQYVSLGSKMPSGGMIPMELVSEVEKAESNYIAQKMSGSNTPREHPSREDYEAALKVALEKLGNNDITADQIISQVDAALNAPTRRFTTLAKSVFGNVNPDGDGPKRSGGGGYGRAA